MLFVQPSSHLSILTLPPLQGYELLLGYQLQVSLLLSLGQKVEDLLEGISVPLKQLIPLPPNSSGLLLILPCPH